MKSTVSLIIFCLYTVFAFSQTEKLGNVNKEGNLIWSDEFEGTGIPDPNKWDRPEYNRRNNEEGPDGWWSREDSYLDGKGNLVIRVRKIENKNNDSDPYDYSVGAVRTKGKFEVRYGKFEIRCKLPTQQGWWVAFWMMQGDVSSTSNSGVNGSEVDIMEGFGWTDKINQAIHWDGYGNEHKSIGQKTTIPKIRDDFHTYTLEWYPEMYIFYIDGKESWRSEGGGVCNQKGYLKVTGEISTQNWAINEYWSNNPAYAQYPDSFVVDYVRVYDIGAYYDPKTGINQLPVKKIKIYPNPVHDNLQLGWNENLTSPSKNISIMNADGRIVKYIRADQYNMNINVEDLDEGLYFLKSQSEESVILGKFLKQ